MSRHTGPTPRWIMVALLAGLAMLGPFAVDTYLPAFPEIAHSLHATPLQVQQTLTVYLFTYALMLLWHGSIADAIGRRPVILVSLGLFAVASIGCASAYRIEYLLFFRGLQGVSAGAGMVLGRAIVRDRFHGAEAQRLLSHVTMLFAIAPAIAPIIGGWLFGWFGWHSIFLFLAVFSLLLLLVCWLWLPETLPHGERQPLRPAPMLASYVHVLLHPQFQLLAAAQAFNFAGFFIYIAAAPAFLREHLGVSAQGFAWLFVPNVIGIATGAYLSGRLAGRKSPQAAIALGYVIMLVAALANLLFCVWHDPQLPWSVLPMGFYGCGMSLAMPNLTLQILELFPRNRGLAASLQGFTQTMLASIVAGAISPLLSSSTTLLATGMLVPSAVGLVAGLLASRRSANLP